MQCEQSKCVYVDNAGECEAAGSECTTELCECFGECISCQEMDDLDCEGMER